MILNEIALRTGTDKSTADHGYCETYERYLRHLRQKPITLVELGVHQGASLRMWDEYFTHPDADIIGIDVLPLDLNLGLPRVQICQGDQAEIPETLQGQWVDVVIDDASHLSSKTIQSFGTWWEVLRSGGLYVVEDLVTSYYLGGHREAHADPDHKLFPPHQTAMQFFRRRADDVVGVGPQHRVFDDMEWLHFYSNMLVAKKR